MTPQSAMGFHIENNVGCSTCPMPPVCWNGSYCAIDSHILIEPARVCGHALACRPVRRPLAGWHGFAGPKFNLPSGDTPVLILKATGDRARARTYLEWAGKGQLLPEEKKLFDGAKAGL